MVKLGQHPVMTVALARDKYTEEAIAIVSDQDKFLVEKKNLGITVNDLIYFYEIFIITNCRLFNCASP